jgi:hypothetical protein
MPNQIDITIRKEFVMTPPPALLSETMQGAAVSSAFGGGGQAVIPAQILVVDEPGQSGRARSRLPDRMTKPFAGIGLQRRL